MRSFGSVGGTGERDTCCLFIDKRNSVSPAEALAAMSDYAVQKPGKNGKPGKTVMRKVITNARARAIARSQYAGTGQQWSS